MTPIRLAAAALLTLGLVLLGPPPGATNSTGAPAGFAGNISSSSGPQTCRACHGSFALNSGSSQLSVDVPGTVVPGETIRVTVALDNQTPTTGTRRQGFQATVRDPATGDAVGRVTLVDPETKFAGFGAADTVYVTHRNADQTSWAFDWTAPAEAPPATVRVYVAGNAANGNGTTSGDFIYTVAADVSLAGVATAPGPTAPAFDLGAASPNPVRGGASRLVLTGGGGEALTVRLVDGRGRTVRVLAAGPRPAGAHVLTVDVGGLAAGPYFVVAEGPSGRQTQPLVVVR